MSTDVATLDVPAPQAVNPLDIEPAAFRGALQRRGDNRKALMEWVRSSLVEGVDFGKIHFVAKKTCDKGANCTNPYHFSKHSLFKPGAEKICGMLNVTATFPTLHEYEQAALSGVALQHLIVRCHLVAASGQIVADGIGARSLGTDYGDINKALKMALKSAHIDATLRMAGLSEVFTQDVEDMEKERLEQGAPAAAPAPAAEGGPKTIPLVPSGMHRGKPWADVAQDYLEWCVRKATGPLADGAKAELELRASLVQTDFEPDMPEGFYVPEEAKA